MVITVKGRSPHNPGMVVHSVSACGHKTCSTAGFTIMDAILQPSDWSDVPERPCTCLAFVLAGEMLERFDGHIDIATTGDFLYRPLATAIARKVSSPVHLLSIELDPFRDAEFAPYLAIHRSFTQFSPTVFTDLPQRLIAEMARAEEASPLKLEGLVIEVIAEASRLPAARQLLPAWLTKALSIMNEGFDASVAAIASRVGIDPVHFAREFRRHCQLPPAEYLRRLRVRKAMQLLASDLPLSEVAVACGFYDQSHFIRVFKALTGVTPKTFRSALARPSSALIDQDAVNLQQ